MYFPRVETKTEFDDLYFRSLWYVTNPTKGRLDTLCIPVDGSFDTTTPVLPHGFDPGLPALIERQTCDIAAVPITTDSELAAQLEGAEFVLYWKPRADFARSVEKFPALADTKVYFVDENTEKNAAAEYLNCSAKIAGANDRLVPVSEKNLEQARLGMLSRDVFVFGTGPSLADIPTLDYQAGVSIVCNSAVANRDLLARLDPNFIVAGDPIFHAGCSEYGADFRLQLRVAMTRYDAYLICPTRDLAVHRAHIPKEMHDRIIGVKPLRRELNLDLENELETMSTQNILTLLMLPLAATFGERVGIFGCDGRPIDEDDYFWKHDPKSQFNDKMDVIQLVHPGFFKVDFNDYYLTHCETLAQIIQGMEDKDITVWSGSFSHIPALVERDSVGDFVLGPFPRGTAGFAESDLMFAFHNAQATGSGTLIDVGAHQGSSIAPFCDSGWTVHGFEPDPTNRAKLLDRIKPTWNLTVNEEAVSLADGETVSFYQSPESTGVSGLSAFLDSHEKLCDVQTVRLDTYMTRKGLGHVDYLKIDTEGHDLFVLQSFPWDSDAPDAIECEFEDNKTIDLGYTSDDLGSWLVDKGYQVLVSEWHPIVRYGISHDFRGLRPFSPGTISTESWGNFLAVRSAATMARLISLAQRRGAQLRVSAA